MKQTKEIEIIEQSPDMKAKLAELAKLVDAKAALKQHSELIKNWEAELFDLNSLSSSQQINPKWRGRLPEFISSLLAAKDAQAEELVKAERERCAEVVEKEFDECQHNEGQCLVYCDLLHYFIGEIKHPEFNPKPTNE